MRVPTTEFQPMHALAAYLVALHQQDLLNEINIARRAKLAQKAQPGVPAWRRSLGGAFAYAARSFDPSRFDGEGRAAGQTLRRAA